MKPRTGAVPFLSAVDLLICATAAQRDLVVLHDDNDFATAARCLPDLGNAPSATSRRLADPGERQQTPNRRSTAARASFP